MLKYTTRRPRQKIITGGKIINGKIKKQPSVLKRMAGYIAPHGGLMLGALVCALISSAGILLAPVITGRAVDYIIGEGEVDFSEIARYALTLGVLIAVVIVFQWLTQSFAQRAAYLTIRDVRARAFDALTGCPLSYIDGSSRGDIMARLSLDADQISDGLIQGFINAFNGITIIAGTIGFMLVLNVYVTLVVVLITPLSLVVSFFIAKGCHKMFLEQAKHRGELSALSEEMAQNRTVIKAFNYTQTAKQRFEKSNSDLQKIGTKAMFYSAMTNPSTRLINGIVYAAVALMGGLMVLYGKMTVGGLTSFLLYANQYTKPFNEITSVAAELQTSLSAARRILDIIDYKNENAAQKRIYGSFSGGVEFKELSFCYEKERPLIENLNIQVPRGTHVAIVGPTGCGKTTLINLLMRFYDPVGGGIYYDGKPCGDYSLNAVRSSCGMVLQDTWIFRGTVRENIAYSKPDASQEEIIAAAKAAKIHNFIKRLERGYDTVIDDDESISAGQKQLINIARVMLLNPPVLILDEATSNIDTRTEIRVQKAFKKLMQPDSGEKKTAFVVAHRLSTIINSDLILVMNEGTVIEQGTHKQLLEQGGFYNRLYNSQFE